jgi:hypothetical protein
MAFDIKMFEYELAYVRVEVLSEHARAWMDANLVVLESMKVDEYTFKIDEADFEAVVIPFILANMRVALNGTQVFMKPNGRVSYTPNEEALDEWTQKLQQFHATHPTIETNRVEHFA